MVDALGNPLSFHLTPGQACDLDRADQLLPNIVAGTVLADKGYDANERVIERLQAQGKTAVIPPKPNRTIARDYDRDLSKARHPIENFFAKLKQYRVMATRYDKRATNFLGAIYLAASVIRLNWSHALDFLLTAARDAEAVKRLFHKAMKAVHAQEPRVINVDNNAAYPKAIDELKEKKELSKSVELQQNKYLNNRIGKDHRFIKRLIKPSMGFGSFNTA